MFKDVRRWNGRKRESELYKNQEASDCNGLKLRVLEIVLWFETVNAQSRGRFKTKKNKIVVCAGGGGVNGDVGRVNFIPEARRKYYSNAK